MSEEEIQKLVDQFMINREQMPEVLKILYELDQIIMNGRNAVYDYLQIGSLFRDDISIANLAYHFFMRCSMLNFEAAVLQCSKLLEKSDSVNVRYVLNLIQNRPRKYFPNESIPLVKDAVKKDFQTLDSLIKEYENIITKRDKEIAHHDKENIQLKWNETVASVLISEITALLNEIDNLLRKYYSFGNWPSPPDFEHYKKAIEHHTQTSISLDDLRLVCSIGFKNLPENASEKLKFLNRIRK